MYGGKAGVGCYYTESDTEVEGLRGCLIGIALQKLGASPPKGTGEDTEIQIRKALSEMGIEGDCSLLTVVQVDQDSRVPWGVAVSPLREKYGVGDLDV
jgi:hypothetical protein